jgi:hypothetical protein
MAAHALRLTDDADPPAPPPTTRERKRRVRTKKPQPVIGYAVYCQVRGKWSSSNTHEIGEMSRSIDLYPDFRGAVEQMINSHCGHDPEAIKRAMIVKVVIDPANAVCIGERKMPAVAAE